MGANLVIGFSSVIHITTVEGSKLQIFVADVLDGSPLPASQCADFQLRSLDANVSLSLLLALRAMAAAGLLQPRLRTSEPGKTVLPPIPDVCDASG